MDDLEHAADLINGAMAALSRAAITNPELRDEFTRRQEHLQKLMDEVEAAKARPAV